MSFSSHTHTHTHTHTLGRSRPPIETAPSVILTSQNVTASQHHPHPTPRDNKPIVPKKSWKVMTKGKPGGEGAEGETEPQLITPVSVIRGCSSSPAQVDYYNVPTSTLLLDGPVQPQAPSSLPSAQVHPENVPQRGPDQAGLLDQQPWDKFSKGSPPRSRKPPIPKPRTKMIANKPHVTFSVASTKEGNEGPHYCDRRRSKSAILGTGES